MRQPYLENRAATRSILDPSATAEMFDDHPTDRKAEAKPLRFGGERIAHLAETLENHLSIVRPDPWPVLDCGDDFSEQYP